MGPIHLYDEYLEGGEGVHVHRNLSSIIALDLNRTLNVLQTFQNSVAGIYSIPIYTANPPRSIYHFAKTFLRTYKNKNKNRRCSRETLDVPSEQDPRGPHSNFPQTRRRKRQQRLQSS